MDNNKLKFGADSGNEIGIKLGEKLDIKAGDITNNGNYKANNIITKTDGTKILIGIKENPSFKDITLGENTNTVNLTATADGLNIGNKKITGIADGTISSTSTDAVTVNN